MVPFGQVELDIRELLSIVQKRIKLILFMTIFAGLFSLLLSIYYITPVYQASTQILVNNSENELNGYRTSDIDRDLKLVETYSVIIKSPRILELVLQRLDLGTSLQKLTEIVAVSRVKNSQVISITVQDESYENAVLVANTIAEVFQQEITKIMKVDNVQILAVAKAESYPSPIKPKPLLNVVLAIVGGLMVSSITIFLLEYFDKYLHNERDVERVLRVPVLGNIPISLEGTPRFEKKNPRHNQQAEQEVAASRTDNVVSIGSRRQGERKLETILDPQSAISESYRTLRTNIQFASRDHELRTLVVTNSGPGKGKPSTIANLAIILAQMGRKVLLVDADMRNPNTHSFFRLSNEKGLSNLLTKQECLEAVIQHTFVPELYLISSGPTPPNPAELLSSSEITKFMKQCEDTFDYILIDTPPVVPVTDAQVLATKVDGVLLVIHAGKTDKTTAKRAKELLEKVSANIIGVVLNDPKKEVNHYYH